MIELMITINTRLNEVRDNYSADLASTRTAQSRLFPHWARSFIATSFRDFTLIAISLVVTTRQKGKSLRYLSFVKRDNYYAIISICVRLLNRPNQVGNKSINSLKLGDSQALCVSVVTEIRANKHKLWKLSLFAHQIVLYLFKIIEGPIVSIECTHHLASL